ncbi:hypothetical protein IWW50_002493 [Coemansia erecta]|nr:hypothetical protein IWW50_002493 [Coemansia erecta]
MISPCARFTSHGIDCPALPPGQSTDYSMTSPLQSGQPLCKYSTPWPTPAATWTAGEQVTVKLAPGGATHGGGHCQFSLSYDSDKTFVVVHEIFGHCFGEDQSQREFTFTLPAGLPSSKSADFAWTWVPAMSGAPEFYMGCSNVAIKGGSTPYTGKEMTIVNWGSYPVIHEFSGNYNTGMEYYERAKNITVG